jgi:hypothetical protein
MPFPGWNTASIVRDIHDWLEGLALVFFAGLVVFDVLAHLGTKHNRQVEKTALICFAIAVIAEICGYLTLPDGTEPL